ncbi:MAG: cation:proton antiporter [Candidatus Aenigmarchaeota archaeon]|nr:cation:proton antiporter [Candidatus Aenigmarchaeota archaeon]
MDIAVFFAIAALIIILGFLGELVFKKTNVPDVLWLMIFGILIGHFFGFYQTDLIADIASIFTTFALIFILFEGGLNLKIHEVFEGMFGGSLLAIVTFIFSVVSVTVVAVYFGFGLAQGVLLGMILGGTSSAVVVPIVKRLTISKQASSSLVLESAITDVLCIVAVLATIEIYGIGFANLDTGLLLNSVLSKFLLAFFIGGVGGYLWLHVLNKMSGHTKSYMITIAFLLLIYSFTEYLKSSGAMACLALGVILGNSERLMKLGSNGETQTRTSIREAERFFYSEISFLVKSFFFVYLGLLMNFSSVEPYLIAGVIVLGLYLMRPISTLVAGKNFTPEDRAVVDSLVPKGLAPAILAGIPLKAGIPGTESFVSIVLACILISILLSTVLVFLAERKKYWGISNYLLGRVAKRKALDFKGAPDKEPTTTPYSEKPPKKSK